jgi:hypothetical protein
MVTIGPVANHSPEVSYVLGEVQAQEQISMRPLRILLFLIIDS